MVGVLAPGGGFAADSDVFVPLAPIQDLSDADDDATSVSVFVSEPARVEEVVAAARGIAPHALVQPWWEVSGFVAGAVQGNRTLRAISTAMSILAVAIPVLALFYIHALRERRKIATLCALGFERAEVFVVYLLTAGILGVLGVVPGIGVGVVLCAWFATHPIYANDGFVIRPLLGLGAVAVPALVVFGTTVAAGLLPAFAAARANPSLTLREP